MTRVLAPAALALLLLSSPAWADERVGPGEGGIGFRLTDGDGNATSVDTKGLTFATPDDELRLRIGGRLQADFGTAGLRGARLIGPFDGNLDYRRTWFESYLTLFSDVDLAFQYDFADPTRPINDAAIAYRGFDPFTVSLGNFKEPFSLGQLISDTNTLFTERPLADVFAPARNFGVAIGAHGESWTAVAGMFGGNANTGIGDNGVAGTGRVTYAPILRRDEVLHLGAAASYRSLDRSGQSLAFSVRPESSLFGTALANTRTIAGAETVGRIGLEAAYQTGPLRLQGEYIRTDVGRAAGQPGLLFHGGYVEAGYTLNGNGRSYSLAPSYGAAYAVFGAPKLDDAQRVTRGGFGLFEIGSRVSYLDLTDRAVRGGREFNYTVGLSWYPDLNVKLMLDYVRAHATGSPAAATPAPTRTVDADIFVGRVQLSW